MPRGQRDAMRLVGRLRSVARRAGLARLADTVRRRAKRATAVTTSAWLRRRTRRSAASLLGSAPVVVSLTSHGRRVDHVAVTIESIGRGSVRPQRLVLWLDDQQLFDNLPAALRAQQTRGLEVCLTENYGPHTKYFPYAVDQAPHGVPLVTADDDIIYPQFWLRRLVDAYAADPTFVSCYRANVVRLEGDRLAPYDRWPRCRDTLASVTRFGTGVSGVIYPPEMLDDLAARGDRFRATAPRADDVWLHWVALQAQRPVRQIARRPRHFPVVPGSQADGLMVHNVGGGGNDQQIGALYTAADVTALRLAGA